MAATYDLTTTVGQVRLLIRDTSVGEALLQDEEITALLALEGDSVKLAAAQALDAIASSESLVSKRIKLLDLSTDGPAVAADLRKHAAALRQQAAETGDGAPDFDWAEMTLDSFTLRERLAKEVLRGL